MDTFPTTTPHELVPACLIVLLWLSACTTASGTEDASPDTEPSNRADETWRLRHVAIDDLRNIQPPSQNIPTTALIARRSRDADESLDDGLERVTRCDQTRCIDGLVSDDGAVVDPQPTDDEAEILSADSAWLERVIRVTTIHEEYVSLYRATSSFSGGAHANNVLECETRRRNGGERLELSDVVDAATAQQFIAEAERLIELETAVTESGELLDAPGYELSTERFRIEPFQSADGSPGRIVLCARGPYPRLSHDVLELHTDEVVSRTTR